MNSSSVQDFFQVVMPLYLVAKENKLREIKVNTERQFIKVTFCLPHLSLKLSLS